MRNVIPASESCTPRELRSNKVAPSSSSRSRICRLNAGCATRNRAAAFVKFDNSATVTKYRKCRRSMAATIPKSYRNARNKVLGGTSAQRYGMDMMTLRKAEERGHAEHGWLDTYHTFSFAGYYDPEHMGFRSLRVINDDKVAPGAGFGMHPHRDMEIITYVLDGALAHKDSMGNGSTIRPGDVQYMAAGTGVQHSEFNPSEKEGVHLLQIWIVPDHKGAKPRYEEKSLAKVRPGEWNLVTSKTGRDGSIAINQDAELYLAKLNAGDKLAHELRPNRHAWLHVAQGDVTVNGQTLKSGDAVAVSNENRLDVAASANSQVLLFDLN
jgi:quercetin 2,3-dioxygenase